MLTLRGEPVAFVGTTRWYIAPWIVDRSLDDRDRRALVVLCQMIVDETAWIRLAVGDESPGRPPR